MVLISISSSFFLLSKMIMSFLPIPKWSNKPPIFENAEFKGLIPKLRILWYLREIRCPFLYGAGDEQDIQWKFHQNRLLVDIAALSDMRSGAP